MTSESKRLVTPENVLAGMFLVLALVFPLLFHAINLGATFLPMLFPIALGGLLLSPSTAALIGFLAPLLSAVMTGMPPFYPPIALLMAVEGVALGGGIALIRTTLHWGVYPSLLSGIVLERLVLALAIFIFAPVFHLPATVFSAGMLVAGIPGVILQLVGIPPLFAIVRPRMMHLREID
ncbi:MAG: ECF transporter S component [Calditrichota bacterium]